MSNYYRKLGKNAFTSGLTAEQLAENYLIKHHWSILHKRFRCPLGEIDLIVQQKDWLLFVEVKKRKILKEALSAISEKQKSRLIQSALYYIDLNNLTNINNIQFDLIAVNQQNQIIHIQNITMY